MVVIPSSVNLTDLPGDILSATSEAGLGVVYDPDHPADTLSMAPFIGFPFGYHQFRQGRASYLQTGLALGVSVATSELLFGLAGRRAGFGPVEWGLGRGLSAIGVRHGGRSYTASALFGPRAGASGFSWSPPAWAIGLVWYELHNADMMFYQTTDHWFPQAIHLAHDHQISSTYQYDILPGTMWDCEPVLYWRCKVSGKLTWRKAKAAFIPSMGMYAIEPPKFPEVKVIESEE